MRFGVQSPIYFLLLLTYIWHAVWAIHCFQCNSETSWSDCDLYLNRKERTCKGPGEIRCLAKMARDNPRDKIKYEKKCATRLENPCHGKRVEDCQVTLCDKDLCNFAITPGATLIASGFRCKQCNSTISWEDCEEHAVEVFCGAGLRKCFKLEFQKSDRTEYVKGCTVPLVCGNSSQHMPNADDRTIKCCGQHICNEAGKSDTQIVSFSIVVFVMTIFLFSP